MANVNIKFNGKDFLLSCDDGQEENLKELANLLNKDLNKKRKKFSSNNLVKVERFYRWPVIVKKYESFFKKILKDSKKP